MLSLPLTHSQRETILQNRWVQLQSVCFYYNLSIMHTYCSARKMPGVADLFPYVKVVPCAVKI